MKRGKGVKVGVIGLGSMGNHHVRVLSTLPGVRLSGAADINFARAEQIEKAYGIPAYDDYRKLLPEIEAVCLVTPAQTHFQIAKDCLNAGKHLLIEKPFTGSSKLAAELLALAKKKNVILAVNLIERCNPAFQKLLKLLKGEKIHGIDMKRFSPFPERISDTNAIFDMMIHDLDLLPMIVPDKIESIRAKGEKLKSKDLDHVRVIIVHKSGIISRLEVNRIFGEKTRKIVVSTDRHQIEADLLAKTIYLRDFTTLIPSTVPVNQVDQLTEILKDFVAAIKGKGLQKAAPEDGIKALALAERVEEACF